tara:strand:+ start:411 stop:533 length:123 start_codon:yes stop_codon:yes gene_type:complete
MSRFGFGTQIGARNQKMGVAEAGGEHMFDFSGQKKIPITI